MDELGGILSANEEQIRVDEINADDILGIVTTREYLHIEVGQPRTAGYAYLYKDGDEYRTGLWLWKQNKMDERSFDDAWSALRHIVKHVVWS